MLQHSALPPDRILVPNRPAPPARLRGLDDGELEIAVLRHQLRVLTRGGKRPGYSTADRVFFVAASQFLPRDLWSAFGVGSHRRSEAGRPRGFRTPQASTRADTPPTRRTYKIRGAAPGREPRFASRGGRRAPTHPAADRSVFASPIAADRAAPRTARGRRPGWRRRTPSSRGRRRRRAGTDPRGWR